MITSAISKKLVEAAKLKTLGHKLHGLIAKADETLLSNNLKEIQKKAFFINVYNGFYKHIVTQDLNNIKIEEPFKSEQFVVQENKVSLDVIEHGF
jgi:hypothetical protein